MNMKKLWKRWLSWILVIALSLSLMPAGALAADPFTVVNGSVSGAGDWKVTVNGTGPTGNVVLYIVLDASTRQAGPTPSEIPIGQYGSRLANAETRFTSACGLTSDLYWQGPVDSVNGGYTYDSSTNASLPKAGVTMDKIRAAINGGLVLYDKDGNQLTANAASYPVLFLFNADTNDGTDITTCDGKLTASVASELKLNHGLTVKTSSTANVALSACQADPAADPYGVGGYVAELENTGDDEILITKLVSGAAAGMWKYYLHGHTSNLATAAGAGTGAVSISLSGKSKIPVYLAYSNATAQVPNSVGSGSGVFSVKYTVGSDTTEKSLDIPWSFKRTSAITATPITINTTTGSFAGATGTSTITIPASILAVGKYKFPGAFSISGSDSTKLVAPTSANGGLPAGVTVNTVLPSSGTEANGDYVFTITVTTKSPGSAVAAGTYTGAVMNLTFANTGAPVPTPATYSVMIPITINVTEGTTITPIDIKFNANGKTISSSGSGLNALPADYQLTPASAGASVSVTNPGTLNNATDGATFQGWATSASGTVISSWPQSVSSNTTYYAIWKAPEYTVTFHPNHSSGTGTGTMSPQTSTNQVITALTSNGYTAPTGKTFDGWATSATGAKVYDDGARVPASGTMTANVDLYAVWKNIDYTVTFNCDPANAGYTVTNPPSQLTGKHYGETLTRPNPDPSVAGRSFLGWYKEAACTNAWDFSTDTMPASNLTLYAKWDVATYSPTVTVYVDGTATNVTSVQLMTDASTTNGSAVTSGTNGVYTFSNVPALLANGNALTFSHATVKTASGTYVAALNQNISYAGNQTAEVYLQTIKVATAPAAATVSEGSALSAALSGNGTSGNQTTIIAPSGTYNITTATSNSLYQFKNWTGGTVGSSTTASTTYTATATNNCSAVTLTANWRGIDAKDDVTASVKEGYPSAVTLLDGSSTPAGSVKNIGMEATGTLRTKITDTDSFAAAASTSGLGAKLTATVGASTLNSGASNTLTVTMGTGLTAQSATQAQTYTAYVWVYDSVTDAVRDRIKVTVTVNPPAGMTLQSDYSWDTYTQSIYNSSPAVTTKTLTVQYDDMTAITGITMPSGAALTGFNAASQVTITNSGATGATATINLTQAQLIAIAADIRSLGGSAGQVTVSATGGSGAKSAAITATLRDTMPTITATEFTGVTGTGNNKTWALGGTFPGVKDTDSNNKSTGQLTGTVVHTWYVNGVLFGTDGHTAPTSADLSVGDVVKVESAGTGDPWTAKPNTGDNYAKTPVQSDSFTVAPPTVTAVVNIEGAAVNTTTDPTPPTASATHVNAGVFNATTSADATKYRFDKWSVPNGQGGFGSSYTSLTSTDAATLFKPSGNATITANWLRIAHLKFNNGPGASGPNDASGTKYTDTVTNDGAGQATSVSIAAQDVTGGVSGTAAKFDVAFDTTTTSINAGAGAGFTVTPKNGTAPGTYTFKVVVTYKERSGDTATKTIEQVLTYVVPKPKFAVKLEANALGTITGTYNGSVTTGQSSPLNHTNDDKTIQVEVDGSVSLTATANAGHKFVRYTSTATAGAGKDTLLNANSASTSYGAVTQATTIAAEFKAVTDLSESHTVPGSTAVTESVGYTTTPAVYTGKVINAGARAATATLTLGDTTNFTLATSSPISIAALSGSTNGETSVSVTAKPGLPAGTYSTTLTITETGNAADTMSGTLQTFIIPITFTVGGANANVTVKLDGNVLKGESVSLKNGSDVVPMTAPTGSNTAYTASGLKAGTAYDVLVNGVDTGVNLTTGALNSTASGEVNLYSLTLKTDPVACAVQPTATLASGAAVTVTPASGTATLGYVSGATVTLSAAQYNTVNTAVYKFSTWADDAASSGSTNPVSSFTVNAQKTVTAKYEQAFGVKYWENVSATTRPGTGSTYFLFDNGQYVSSSSINLPGGPTPPSGKVFKGWGTASNTAVANVLTSPVTKANLGSADSDGNYNLYAIYEDLTYTWNQDANKTLTDGMYGVNYGDSVVGGGVTDNNGQAVAVHYRLASGQALPEGLTLSANGAISGKPYVTYVSTPKSFRVEAVMGATVNATTGAVTGGTVVDTKTFTIKVDKYTPVLNVSNLTGVTAGGATSGAKLTGTVDAPFYTGTAWVTVANKLGLNDSFTDVQSGGATAKPSGTVSITTPSSFNASSATTCTIQYTPGAQLTGATGQATQKFSDIYNAVTTQYTATLGALTYTFDVDPASQVFTVTQGQGNYSPANKLFKVTYTGNQDAYLQCSWSVTDPNNDKFRLEGLTDTGKTTLQLDAGGEVVNNAVRVTPLFDTTVGTYTVTARLDAYDNENGTGTPKHTQYITLVLEVKPPEDFAPTVNVYQKAVNGSDTPTSITTDNATAANVGVRLVSLADGTTALVADTPTTAGVYTWTTHKPVYGTSYKVQINDGRKYDAWTDTGLTLSAADLTGKDVHLYEVALATNPNGVGATLTLDGDAYTVGTSHVYVLSGRTVTALTNEPTGYTFDKWSTNDTTLLTNHTVTDAVTLTANFAQKYTVKFDGNGADTFTVGASNAAYADNLAATMLVGGVNSYANGATIGVAAPGAGTYAISKAGSTFRGWALTGDANGAYSFTAGNAADIKDNATADHVIVLKAVWTTDSTLALAPAVITGTYKHAALSMSGGAVTGGAAGNKTYAAVGSVPYGITYTAASNSFAGTANVAPDDVGAATADFKVTDTAGGEATATYTFIIGKADVKPSTTAGEGLPTGTLPVGGVTATAIENLFTNTKMNGDGTGENDVKGEWKVDPSYTLPTTPGTYTVPVAFNPKNQGANPTGVNKYEDHYNPYTTTIQVTVQAKEITAAGLNVTVPVVGQAPMTLSQLVAASGNTLTSASGTPLYTGATGGAKDVKIAAITWSPNNNPFQGGTDYTVRVTLEIEPGSEYIFADGVTGTIAGNNATVEAHNATTVTLAYTFPKKITVIDVSADTPVAGNTDAAVTVPAAHQNEYTIEGYWWVEQGTTLNTTSGNENYVRPGHPFDKTEKYDLIVKVQKKDGIEFVTNITSINAAGSNMTTGGLATVNGDKPPKGNQVAKSDSAYSGGVIDVRYDAFEPIDKVIKDIYVEGNPGVYYAKTALSGDRHNDATATGNNSGVGFDFSAGGISVYPIYEDGTRGTTPLSSGYTIGKRDLSQATPTFTSLADGYTFVKNAGTDDVANWDGQTLWVKYTVSGVDKYAPVGGTLVVKELQADSITLSANPTLTYQTGGTFAAAGTASVGFNSTVPGLSNTVSNMSAAGAAVSYVPTTPAAAGDVRPSFYYVLDVDNDGVIEAADTQLVPGTTTITADMRGKTVYGCYTDVNGHLVTVRLGNIDFTSTGMSVTITDENGHDPEYGDVLTATPTGGVGPYTYQWVIKGGNPDGSDKPITGATDSTYVPTGDDIGETVKVIVTDSTGATADAEMGPIQRRSLNFDVAPKNKKEDGDKLNYTGDKPASGGGAGYTSADFTLKVVTDTVNYGGVLTADTGDVTLDLKTALDILGTEGGTANAQRPMYSGSAAGSTITWPAVAVGTDATTDKTGGYDLGGDKADCYRLAAQGAIANRGTITAGDGIVHVDVRLKAPVNSQPPEAKPTEVTSVTETTWGTGSDFSLTWYKTADFDAANLSANVHTGNFDQNTKYTVVIPVKAVDGKKYDNNTEFWFHEESGKGQQVELKTASAINTPDSNGKKSGVLKTGDVYYMVYTFDATGSTDTPIPQSLTAGSLSTTLYYATTTNHTNAAVTAGNIMGDVRPTPFIFSAAGSTSATLTNSAGATSTVTPTSYELETVASGSSTYTTITPNTTTFTAADDGKKVYAVYDDGTNTPLKAYIGTLSVKELTAEVIKPTLGASGVQLNYAITTSGGSATLDLSGVTGADVDFNQGTTAIKNTANPTYAANAAKTSDNYYFEYYDGSAYVGIDNGAALSVATHHGKNLYICYTDVNNHTVRALLGTLNITDYEAPTTHGIKATPLSNTVYYMTTTGTGVTHAKNPGHSAATRAAETAPDHVFGDKASVPFAFDATGVTVTETKSDGTTADVTTSCVFKVDLGGTNDPTLTAGDIFVDADTPADGLADYDGKQVYVAYTYDATKPPLKAYVGTLTVKPLTAEVITPTVSSLTLSYTIGTGSTTTTLDLAGVTEAKVDFNKDTMKTTATKAADGLVADTDTTVDPKHYYFELWKSDNSALDRLVKHGDNITTADNGKILYICYKDVNENVVKARLGDLKVINAEAPTVVKITATPLEKTFYYMTTKGAGVSHAKNPGHNDADRANAPGDKSGVPFKFSADGVVVTKVMSDGTTQTAAAGDLTYWVRDDSTSPATLTQINLNDIFVDSDNDGKPDYDGLPVYVKLGSDTAYVGTLTIRELTAERITPTIKSTGVKLSYSVGNMTLDLSGVEGATVKFNMDTADLNTTYTTNTGAGDLTYAANASKTVKNYYYQTSTDGVNFTAIDNGATLTSADDGKTIYICYTDVNEHTVRAAIGTLSVNDENGSTAAIRLENKTHANDNTQYGDNLQAVVMGATGTTAAGTLKYTWQVSADGSTNWTDLDSATMQNVTTDTWQAIKHVGKFVRVVLSTDGGKDVGSGTTADPWKIVSNVLEIEPKAITIPYTWVTGSKTYDATTAVPNAATTVTPDSAWTDQLLTRDSGKITLKAFTAAAFADADVGTGKAITLTGAGVLESSDTTNNPVSNYTVTVVEPKGAITQRPLTWADFEFEPKVKRYDGSTTVYKVDNYDLVKENTDASLNNTAYTGAVGYGSGKADNGLWGLASTVASDLVAPITGEVQVKSVVYGSAGSLQPREDHVASATEKAAHEGRSVLKVTLGYVDPGATHNFTLPSGEFIVEYSAINPKKVIVSTGYRNPGVPDGYGVMTGPAVSNTTTDLRLSGTVNTDQTVGSENVGFTVAGRVDQPIPAGATQATIHVVGVKENESTGIYWENDNYKLVWGKDMMIMGTVQDGAPTGIVINSISNVVYGESFGEKVIVSAEILYDNASATGTFTNYTFDELAARAIKAIVAHDTDSDGAVNNYDFAASNTLAGWDNGTSNTQASLTVKFFKAADAANADQTTYNSASAIGTGTIKVDQRELNVAAAWQIDNDPAHQSKFYDGATTAIGSVWDAAVTTRPLPATAGNTGSMTFTYDNWAFNDAGHVAVNTTGLTAAFADKNVGTNKTITVNLNTSAPFAAGATAGNLSNRYKKGNVQNATGAIVARPIEVDFGKQSVLKDAPETVNLRKELAAADGLMAGDTCTVAGVGTYTTDTSTPHVYDKTAIVGDFTGNVAVSGLVWDNTNYTLTAKSPINGEVKEPTPTKHPYLDVVVDASQPTLKGQTLTGPTVDESKPYELIDADSKWQYWTGSAWADVTNGTGLTSDGKTLPDTEYRVVAKVQLKADERDKYYLSTSTSFKLATKTCSTDVATAHETTLKQLNPSAAADTATHIYGDDTTYVLYQTFKTPADVVVPDTEILDVNVFFKDQPADGGTIPGEPNDVRNSEKETMTGEASGSKFVAHWYENTSGANAWDPTSPAGNGWSTAGAKFEAGKYYTVAVKVKAQDGYTYVLDQDDHADDTKFIFHFGQNDTVEVVKNTVAEATGVKHGLYTADNIVYTMYYTFQIPASEIDKITAVDGTFDDPHYAATGAHHAADGKVPNGESTATGQPDFTLNYTINSITVHYKGESASTTHTIASTTTDPAEQAILAQVKAHVNGVDLTDGYTFTQTTNDGSTKTATGRFDNQKVQVSIGSVVSPSTVTLKDANDATKDTLTVKELQADDIEPVYKTGETAIKLNYDQGDAFDPSNITDANVDFLTGVTGLAKADVIIADEMTSNTGTDQTKYYYELDNGTRLKTGDAMNHATMDGRDVYICYTDVNGHEVREHLGTLRVKAPEDPTIVKVAANVKQPIAGQTIANAGADVLLAISADNRDVTDKVETGTVTWTNISTSGAALGTTFQAGGSYKAEFDVKIKSGNTTNKFVAVADPANYLDLLINGVTHTDKSWLDIKNASPAAGKDTQTVGADGSINQIKVDVEPTSTGSEETSYKITVTFNKISDKANILAVLGTAKIPEAGAAVAAADIKPLANQPYELVTDSNKWYEQDGTTEITDPAAQFKPGKSYYAELTVKLKDAQKPYYQFTQDTTGSINSKPEAAAGAEATVDNTKVTRTLDTAGIEPKTITMKLKFDIPTIPVNVIVRSDLPAIGGTAADMNATIKNKYDPESDGHYKVDLTKAYWADQSGAKLDGSHVFAPGRYQLVFEEVTPDAGYTLPTTVNGYTWQDGSKNAVNIEPAGDGKYKVVFNHTILEPGVKVPDEIAVVVTPPVAGQTPDKVGKPGNDNTEIVGEVKWTDPSGAEVTGKFDYEKEYTATVIAKPVDPDNFDPTDPKYKFNGHSPTKAEPNKDAEGNPDGTYTLVYTFPKTAKKETIDRPVPSGGGGGGGGSTVELPQVFYKLGEVGVTDDLTAEKVKMNGKPKKVPKVEGLQIEEKDGTKKTYTFIGWSETDPAKTTGTPVLVDPTTFKITKDKTFYAVYEIQGHTAVDHSHYVIGFPNGTFGPGADITRGEVATIIARACLDGFIEGANYGNPGGYNDVERHWAYSAISYCTINSVFTGYTDGTFRPDQPITRQELATVVARLAGLVENQGMPFTDAGQVSKWALDGVYTAYANGWINGYKDGSFKPLQNITRAETVKVFNAYLKRGVNAEGLSDMREYVHDGVASNNKENGFDQYMTWPDVPKSHWAYYEIIEAANDHTFYWLEDDNPTPPEHWTSVWIDEVWRYHDDNQDGARPVNPDTTTPSYSYGK